MWQVREALPPHTQMLGAAGVYECIADGIRRSTAAPQGWWLLWDASMDRQFAKVLTGSILDHTNSQEYGDLSNPATSLKAASVSHGDMIFMLYRCVTYVTINMMLCCSLHHQNPGIHERPAVPEDQLG